jgi:DNA-binding SARP family transcriptional activator
MFHGNGDIAMFDVRLFGGVLFSVAGTVIRSECGPAGRLLACYLLEFPGRVHRRERLADLFWSDAEPVKARAALNTAIWRIRKILDQGADGASRHLVTVGDDVILEPSDVISVDTHRLDAACRSVLDGAGHGRPDCDRMRDIAVALAGYHGPFLDGHDGEWILQERERLHCLFVRGMFELMRHAAVEGRYECALDLGRRILAVDVMRERIQQVVMLLLVLNGQRGEAIRAYQRLVGLLKSELDIAPMPDTKRIHDDILSGDIFARIHDDVGAQFGAPAF